jgi:hypothetical protein
MSGTILSPTTLSIAPSSLIVRAQSDPALPVQSMVPDTISYSLLDLKLTLQP